jgi:hypothetical protein
VLQRTYDLNDTLLDMREDIMVLLGQTAALNLPKQVTDLSEAEFRVFSQFGEDGIIAFLTRTIKPPRTFVEFGVQTYRETNTRFLMHNGWRGVVFDHEQAYIDRIRAEPGYHWKNYIHAERAHITVENINDLFQKVGMAGDIGLLSIDVDGVDYHLWEALSICRPAIVVIEYNRGLPINRPLTVPYDPDFDRDAQPMKRYSGASLSALVHLAKQKGYQFIGIERHQANAFFVHQMTGALGSLPASKPGPEHVAAINHADYFAQIADLLWLNVVTGKLERVIK